MDGMMEKGGTEPAGEAEPQEGDKSAGGPPAQRNRNFLSRAKASETANQMPIRSQTDLTLGG